MAWVTAAEASDITGQTVTEAQVNAAHPIIELYTNVTTETSAALKPRDLRLLKYAEAYQAYWMASQVDVLSRMDADHVTQDGLTFQKGDEDALVLAPLAKKCIVRLSWNKSRSIQPLTPEQALVLRGYRMPGTVLGTEEWLDDEQHWEPLGGDR